MYIHGDPGVGEARYIVKMDGRTVFADLGEGAGCSGYIWLRQNLIMDAKHLPFLLETDRNSRRSL